MQLEKRFEISYLLRVPERSTGKPYYSGSFLEGIKSPKEYLKVKSSFEKYKVIDQDIDARVEIRFKCKVKISLDDNI